jgi:formamidopyrimidine-DNA glycosylase
MPELPEVEIMSRNLNTWMTGHTLTSVEVRDDKFDFLSFSVLEGRLVTRVWRRAKYAIVDLSGGLHLVLHYRMTGKTILDPKRQRRARIRWVMDSGAIICFEDIRRFGTVEVLKSADLSLMFENKKIGPEPWPERRSASWWAQQYAAASGFIKPMLMRQERVAGLGNIAASEICFRALIHPETPLKRVDLPMWSRIASATHAFIDHTLAQESGPEIAYVKEGGEGSFSVYGHSGKPCPTCGHSIERIMQSSRSSFFCPKCQPLS